MCNLLRGGGFLCNQYNGRIKLQMTQNSTPNPAQRKPFLPYWRYVEYADDGCAVYQCLACTNQWTARTEPGYFSASKQVDGPGEGVRAMEYSQGDETCTAYFRDLPAPRYIAIWQFCPYCGVHWAGPIECNLGNERMLGLERLIQEKAIRNRRQVDGYKYTGATWWWLIQRGQKSPSAPSGVKWANEYVMDPHKHNAAAVRKHLQWERERVEEEHSPLGIQFRATTIPDKDRVWSLREYY